MDNWYILAQCFNSSIEKKECVKLLEAFHFEYETKVRTLEEDKDYLLSKIIELEERISKLEK